MVKCNQKLQDSDFISDRAVTKFYHDPSITLEFPLYKLGHVVEWPLAIVVVGILSFSIKVANEKIHRNSKFL